MQNVYCTAGDLCTARDNIVDFTAYRRRLLQEGSLAPKVEEPSFPAGEDWSGEDETEGMEERTIIVHLPSARPAVRSARPAWVLDIAASVGVVVMTLAFAAQVLLL